MAIKTIEILNVMVFQSHLRKNNADFKTIEEGDSFSSGFKLKFCDGINVLIGENGVGKTTVLKMIYAATQWSIRQTDQGKTKRLLQFFSNSLSNSDDLKNESSKEDYCYYKVSDGTHCFEESLSHKALFNYEEWLGLNIQSVFIPTTEMLSHSKGFLALNQKYNMPFDGTQIDIIVNASLPEAREIPAVMKSILDKISNVIEGTVILEDDSFYVLKKDGRKTEFSLEAEGLRKLGLIWKLIRNGLLESGTVLLWDEPEANLNPELYPFVADILLELQKNGVQIFVATHSYNFAKYLEIRRKSKEQVMFHNLYKSRNVFSDEMKKVLPGMDDSSEAVYSQSAYRMDEIEHNHIMIADNRLLDEVYEL
ncbi:MAG: AAA family ATPase [Eubacterium sp.]|nr:AAA family ATPase [Eubacterium sp.]